MNRLVQLAVNQPITVAVAVILAALMGVIAATRAPVQMTPQVDSVVISVSTTWENASPQEIESDVIEQQEERLGDLTNLISMTSVSQAGRGQIRLEFRTGTDIDAAMAEVDQKLNEVPGYPTGVDEPVVEDVDPESVDYIAWIGLSSTDPSFDATTLYDFMERRLRPRFERIPGVSQVGIRGAREAEVQIRVDPVAMAQRGITWSRLVEVLRLNNENFSGGRLPDGKSDVRVRAVGRFHDADLVRDLVVQRTEAGPIYLRDIADVVETHKEMTEWVRARGQLMPFFNFQLETGGNLLDTMAAIQAEVRELNAPGGLLEQEARRLGLDGTLELVQTYDATTYVTDALALVRGSLLTGSVLAVITLFLFLRSVRTIAIIGVTLPISVIGAVVFLVAMGRSINIISLAGMAFASGMTIDSAIVVIENIFRHLEMGKPVRRAALDGTREVASAVVASTLTTLVVFLPILLIQEAAGQLFRDIALAIMAAVAVSMIVSITVIPSAAGLLLRQPKARRQRESKTAEPQGRVGRTWQRLRAATVVLGDLPSLVGGVTYRLTGGWSRRLIVIGGFTAVTVLGIAALIAPIDYLPRGNRNIVFSVLIPPPGYNLEQLSTVGSRMEDVIRPAWEIAGDRFGVEKVRREREGRSDGSALADRRPEFTVDHNGQPTTVTPPPLDHYFLVAWEGRVFQVAISQDTYRVVDALPLMDAAIAGANAPDVLGFSFQFPLFRQGGTTGSAIKIDLVGDDLDAVTRSAGALLGGLVERFGPMSVQPEPANFLLGTPEMRITADDERLREMGMSRRDVGFAVAASGDGILLPRQYQLGGELKDLKLITHAAGGSDPIGAMLNAPIATPDRDTVDLRSIARVDRLVEVDQIKHVDRQRAVTLQLTPPTDLALQTAIEEVNRITDRLRHDGAIAQGVEVNLAGSAGKLAEIQRALMGDGSLVGTLGSSLFLALLVVYLLMVVLFQSWTYPLVIMISVPLATLGGFAGLALVRAWSLADRYMPDQNLDVLTILGFVILAGVVVNNAILIVEQTLNFMRQDATLTPREAIRESVSSRVRPILMSTLTSVGGMLPLVLLPGAGSELYRGLGAVVLGGLVVSTVFTLVLVPVVLSVLFDLRASWRAARPSRGAALHAAEPV